MPKNFTAAKAFIINNGKILIIRESKQYLDTTTPGTYDVPGGRTEDGQSLTDSLIREVKGETNLDITIGEIFYQDEWHPVVRDEEWHIKGSFFLCTPKSAKLKLSPDHDDYQWINPEDYKKYQLHTATQNAFETYLKS